MTLAMKLREEREEGIAQGEARQRAKDEAELKKQADTIAAQAERIAQLEAHLAKNN